MDFHAGNGNPGGIGDRQIFLRIAQNSGKNFNFALAGELMVIKSFFIGIESHTHSFLIKKVAKRPPCHKIIAA